MSEAREGIGDGVGLMVIVLVDDDFIKGLFEIIEDLSYDANDPYHYPVIRVLVSSTPGFNTEEIVLTAEAGSQRAIHDFSP